jgi:anti-sigma factor RsiW
MSQDDEVLSALIRRYATRHAAPDGFRAAIRTQVALAEAGRAGPPLPAAAPRRRWFDFGWRTAAVSFALGLACAWVIAPVLQHLQPSEPLDADLVADHVRALSVGPLTEVASSDRHTVKPWFQGRLDFSPPVFDLAAEGFPLSGGRTDRVRGNTVAALTYMHNRHVIDVFVWPSAERQPPLRTLRKGFNVLYWADGSMQYWAVSDVERVEMERFAQLWQARGAAQ